MEEISPNQNQALCLLAAGYSAEEIAKSLGVSRRTIDNWKKLPNFKKLLRKAIAATYEAAIAELICGSREAAIELKTIISDPETPRAVKVRAISVLLGTAAKIKDLELEERLEYLESFIENGNQPE